MLFPRRYSRVGRVCFVCKPIECCVTCIRPESETRVDSQCARAHVPPNELLYTMQFTHCTRSPFVHCITIGRMNEKIQNDRSERDIGDASTHRRCVNVHIENNTIEYNYRLSLHKMMTRYCVAHSNDRSLSTVDCRLPRSIHVAVFPIHPNCIRVHKMP